MVGKRLPGGRSPRRRRQSGQENPENSNTLKSSPLCSGFPIRLGTNEVSPCANVGVMKVIVAIRLSEMHTGVWVSLTAVRDEGELVCHVAEMQTDSKWLFFLCNSIFDSVAICPMDAAFHSPHIKCIFRSWSPAE